ncbi:uncharacterized protein LOC121875264 [Homarus americanus]|uniref:uncharacterized protein LOC121875264 n=1 Tax=Homarus americanus TaxID=6706 RepID=UPI001C44D8EE|nr:uncharacterized protein LOC121875264 [Homarus americanus]
MVLVLRTNLIQKCCHKTSVIASVIIFVLLVSVYQEDNVKESDKDSDTYSEEAGEQRRGALVYRGGSGKTGVSVNRCRSLFTITGVPDDNTLVAAHLLQYPADNNNLTSNRWTPLHPRGDQHLSAAVKGVRHLLQKRSSSSGASTEDYRSLAALLPTLLTFQHHTNKSQEDDHRKEGQTPILRHTSRIDANGGVLPYVPCAIVPFDHPPSVTACFAYRLLNNNSLWIAFMGDSKVRELFYEFLMRTDSEYYYMIHFMDRTESWEEVKKKYLEIKMKEDMEATTEAALRLRITFSFKSFSALPKDYNTSIALRQLARWASRTEQPPDLLVVDKLITVAANNDHDVVDQRLKSYLRKKQAPPMSEISKVQQGQVSGGQSSRFRPYVGFDEKDFVSARPQIVPGGKARHPASGTRAIDIAAEIFKKYQENMKRRYDKKSRSREFKPGDHMLAQTGNPLKARFCGPWVI